MISICTSLCCCKIWQGITRELCLSKCIINSQSRFWREDPAFLNILGLMYGQFHEITDASWHITRLINHEDLECRAAARECEEHKCQNINEKDVFWMSQRRAVPCRMGREVNMEWILKQSVWFCCVAHALERGLPSVLLSPWPVSASVVCLSHLSSCYGTSPPRPWHRLQRAKPYHQSHRWATCTTGSSLQWRPGI